MSNIIKDVQIFAEGKTSDGREITNKDLDDIVNNTNIAIKENQHMIPIKIGHYDSTEEAKGWVENVRKKGSYIIADFVNIASDIAELSSTIFNSLKTMKAKRFVLDSLSLAAMGWKETEELPKMRLKAFDMINALKKTEVTSMLISEIPRSERDVLSRFGFEEFVVDGVILLQSFSVGGPVRSLQILKMRRTNHGKKIYPFDVTEKGLALKSI